jgi:hypothetical protein
LVLVKVDDVCKRGENWFSDEFFFFRNNS